MNVFMVEMHLPEVIGNDFLSRMPRHREHIHSLINKGVVLNYSVNMERSKAWVIVAAENSELVEQVVEEFPIYKFLSYDVFDLLFYDTESLRFPRLAMN